MLKYQMSAPLAHVDFVGFMEIWLNNVNKFSLMIIIFRYNIHFCAKKESSNHMLLYLEAQEIYREKTFVNKKKKTNKLIGVK